MEFDKRKAATLLCISSTEIDKSPKGTLDAPILPLIKSINQHPSYFTTSSCSGRISILSQPPITTTTASKKKARGGSWIFISHEPADPNSVIDLLFNSVNQQGGDLVFRFEPFILAIECRDISSAQTLVSTAISCGFRESGITSVHKRVIIAIRCSIRLEVPLGEIGKLMVSPNYVRFLVGLANEKMENNRKRTDCFFQVFQRNLLDNGIIVAVGTGTEKEASKDKDSGGAENDGNIESTEMVVDYCDSEKEKSAAESGRITIPQRSISVVKTLIVGEPVEKLFLWGHSACTLYNGKHHEILVFGGFGGLGRHARRNDTLIYHPQSGSLRVIDVEGQPSPRMGHTSSVVGEGMFVIGGRGDPTKILNDVWVFNAGKKEWRLLECSGSVFHPRHRHAAAVVGSKIYVFGGLNNEAMSSSMYVLDTENSQWDEINIRGEWPCARHSHALVSNGSQIFMFGGYDGEKSLRDLYSFDTKTCLWKNEKTEGRHPLARFSHSMFIYKNYLGIIGGCPVRQHYQEMALLDLRFRTWRHLALNSVGKDLFVRSSVNVVGDDLVIIGGGASCYAFGTKFSEPMKISLSIFDSITPEEMPPTQEHEAVKQSPNNEILTTSSVELLDIRKDVEHWVLRLQRKDAKLGKDILKKFGWLDLVRKVYCGENGAYVCLPVTESFCTLFHQNQGDRSNLVGVKEPLRHDISGSTGLDNLFLLGGSVLKDELTCIRKAPKSPQKILSEAVDVLIRKHGLPPQLVEEIPARWERLGNIVVLPITSFKDPIWNSIREELWPMVAKLLGANRLARQGRVASTGTRDSGLDILVGEDGWVDHRENGILYSFDATKCMFSWGNLSEKLRMGRLDCGGEVIVDLFAGIGYFTLPFLVRANAKMVYACEWNPHAVAALKRNVELNLVDDRCVIFEGDNRKNAPKGIADRVCLGLLPSSECSWLTAVRALRIEGGMMHVHGNAKDSEESVWSDHVAETIHNIAKSEGLNWDVSIQHLERVKWYGPRIRHLVADVRCKQTQQAPANDDTRSL
ncbi:hypothetical protein ACHQM5_003542 [Ranunculus cassubicifolius]